MTIWIPDLTQHSGPRYEAIADAIADAASSGELAGGDRLPPQRQLAFRLGVTVGTVSRGYTLAERRGLVRGEVGRGTYVCSHADTFGQGSLSAGDDGAVELSMNMPVAPANAGMLADALSSLANSVDCIDLLRYMPTNGHPAHRAAAAHWISRSGLAPSADSIVLTQGAQQGLAAVFTTLAKTGDEILVESCTYTGLIENARLADVRLKGVAIDDEGMRADDLDRVASESDAKIVIVVPTIQNPTSAIMSESRRRAIADVVERHDLVLIEDDVYGYLLNDRPPPIAAFIPEQTIYVTSASKCLAPGLRVGWLVAPEKYIRRIIDLIYAHSVAQPALNHEIVRRWIDDGTAAQLVTALARETATRHELAVDLLGDLKLSGHPASFHALLELPQPWRRDEFVTQALERNVRVSNIDSFTVERETAPEAIRLSLVGARNRSALTDGLTSLRELIDEGPRAKRTVV